MYIGHKREDGTIQSLHDHLANVSKLAGLFARARLKYYNDGIAENG